MSTEVKIEHQCQGSRQRTRVPRVRLPGGPLTVRDAAEAARVSETMIRTLCATGQLRHHRVGLRGRGAIRIDEADFWAWWESTLAETTEGRTAGQGGKGRKGRMVIEDHLS